MRGEFLAVTFSWEMIGPVPKFSLVVVRPEETGLELSQITDVMSKVVTSCPTA